MTGEPIFLLRGRNNEIFEELRATGDVSLLVNWVFWNFWSRRLFPYSHIEKGQTLYFVDTDAREIGAELRVTEVAPMPYADPDEPYRVLDRVFGIGSEKAATALQQRDVPVPGYLLAVAVDPVAYLGVPIELDWSKVGGRAGWAAWRTVLESDHTPEASKQVLRGLPREGRPPAARSYPIDLGAVTGLADLPRAPRTPTVATAKVISARAQGKCEHPGCDGPADHLDHKYPWARGGNSEPANLQWLCRQHNLRKSDSIPETYSPDQLWMRFITELDAEEIKIGGELQALEVRTRNSVYDIVVDGDEIFLCWKRGGRQVYVEQFDGVDALISARKGNRYITIQGHPAEPKPLFSSSRIVNVTERIDPVASLARIGKQPGDTLRLTHSSDLSA